MSVDFKERLILGTATLGGVWGDANKADSVKTVLTALEMGIGTVDTAPAYGDAEMIVGLSLKDWRGKAPEINTKVGRLKTYSAVEAVFDYSDEGMQQSLMNSLNSMNIPQINTLFLHEPGSFPEEKTDSIIKTLVQFKKRGWVKRLGVGGNSPSWFWKYIRPEVFDVVMEYNRINACNLEALETTYKYCTEKGIDYYVASPLNMGLLGNRYDALVEESPAWISKDTIARAGRVKQIADENNLSLTTLAHRFLISLSEAYKLKIVIGPASVDHLKQTMRDVESGPLPENIFDRIMSINS